MNLSGQLNLNASHQISREAGGEHPRVSIWHTVRHQLPCQTENYKTQVPGPAARTRNLRMVVLL